MKKRAISGILALFMLFSLLPLTAEAGGDVDIDESTFPDPVFREYVKSNIDKDGSETLDADEINDIFEINVEGLGISTLKGVELFTNLGWLNCANNQLKTLDIKNNTRLKELDCGGNQLTALDVSRNTQLTALSAYGNQLTALDVRNNTQLEGLFVYGNRLTALDVKNNTQLGALTCSENQLTELNVSRNPQLEVLECYANRLAELDESQTPS